LLLDLFALEPKRRGFPLRVVRSRLSHPALPAY
jgi:hypothetical protein